MKAITIWQPWASLIASGSKKYETRGWATSYRGPIAIHAAARDISNLLELMPVSTVLAIEKELHCKCRDLPRGVIIATAQLVNVWGICYAEDGSIEATLLTRDKMLPEKRQIIVPTKMEKALGDWTPGRCAWEFADVKLLEIPIRASGKQGFWNWEPMSDIL